MIDLKEIKELVRYFEKTELTEIEVEKDGVRVKLRKEAVVTNIAPASVIKTAPVQNVRAPVNTVPSTTVTTEISAGEIASDKFHTIKAPIIGTFYRSSTPDKESFVKVGDTVQKGQVLCIIEAMKIFNEIESDAAGRVAKILVENAKPVEYEQPLFVIELLNNK